MEDKTGIFIPSTWMEKYGKGKGLGFEQLIGCIVSDYKQSKEAAVLNSEKLADKYLVVKTQNFDGTNEAISFSDYKKACAYLHWLWEDYLNDEYASESDIDEDETYHEDDYAKVRWADGCQTEFRVIRASEPNDGFESVNWERYAP